MYNKLSYRDNIFQKNVFSKKGLNKYIKHITKENEIRKDKISILSEENCNEHNLNLIKLSEKNQKLNKNMMA